MPEITLEQLTQVDPVDARSLAALLGPLVRADAALGWTTPPDEDTVLSLLTGLVAAGPSEACVLLARVRGEDSAVSSGTSRVAGFGYWRRYERPTHRPHADLEKLAVSMEFAGRGVGRALLRALVETARNAGIEQLTLDFRGDNHAAERLYVSEGFREYGRLPDFVAPDPDRRFDMVLHVLDLRD